MKSLHACLALVLTSLTLAAHAAPDCAAQAADKKLAGAAKTSFMKKCERDSNGPASPECESKAAEKKLAGAAKNSFVKKCMKDAAATKPASAASR